jgi:two-component system cell cycle response regulator DivK
MDIQLPDMDGLAALHRFRAASRTATTPVVALTAFAMTDDRARFLDAGFDGYIAKPIQVKEFPAQVRQFCARDRQEG